MNDSLTAISHQLDAQAEKLRSEMTELQQQLDVKQEELQRLDTARTALAGKKPRQKVTAQKNQRRPAPTKEKVTALVEAALQSDHPRDIDSLQTAVAKQLVEDGYSKVGFSLRFSEVVAGERFASQLPNRVAG